MSIDSRKKVQDLKPTSKRAKADPEQVYDCDKCDYKFGTKFKLLEHRICIHNQSMSVLPIEVFENILDFLHPNDLVEVSRTSKNYNNLVTDYFKRKRQCGWATINGGPHFSFHSKEKNEIYFRSIVRNVMVQMTICDHMII